MLVVPKHGEAVGGSSLEAFEHVVKVYLEHQGYVVTNNVKFYVRRQTGRRAYPEFQTHGYDVDIVAARENELLLGSVKSYFGSQGVTRGFFKGLSEGGARHLHARATIFNESDVRKGIVEEAKRIYGYPVSKIHMALFVGRFAGGTHEEDIRQHLRRVKVGGKSVEVVGIQEIADTLLQIAESKTYHDDAVVMTLKVLRAANKLPASPDE
jgi:hypothetical protein